LAYFNDKFVVEQELPCGTIKEKCDYYSKAKNIAYDGLIPYLKYQHKYGNNTPFFVCANFDNPHDVLYTNITTDIENLQQVSNQINGVIYDNVQSVSDYNNNFRLFHNLKLNTLKSFTKDNNMNSSTNENINSIGILFEILSKFYYFGNDYTNKSQMQEYQTAYYRCVKQVDDELNKIYDYLELNNYFETAVICVTADHGDYLGAHGLCQKGSAFYTEAFNVPLFISYPNMNNKFKNSTQHIVMSHMNLISTLFTLAKITNSSAIIKSNCLQSSFIDTNLKIIKKDYKIVKLCLSITFGPLLYLIAKSLNIDEINNILNTKLKGQNYLTIPTFSVSTVYEDNCIIYNSGYFFSLVHIFFETIKHTNNICFDSFYKSDEQYIINDTNMPFGFIGSKTTIIFQAATSKFIKNNFKNIKISKYDPSSTEFNYNLGVNKIFRTYIVSRNHIANFDLDNFDLKQKINKKYTIINKQLTSTNQSIKYFSRSREDLELLIKYDSILNSLISEPIIVKLKDSHNDAIKINHPIIPNVTIKISTDILKNVIDSYTNYNELGKIVTQLTMHKKNYHLFSKFLDGGNFFMENLINKIISFSNNNGLLKLPGVNQPLLTLLCNGFEVLTTDLTNDPHELINLADTSRLSNKNIKLVNLTLDVLNTNIKYNNLENIFISLPSDEHIKLYA
jgi:hemoglobin-like flavoprotein